jgi:hypothetical protein
LLQTKTRPRPETCSGSAAGCPALDAAHPAGLSTGTPSNVLLDETEHVSGRPGSQASHGSKASRRRAPVGTPRMSRRKQVDAVPWTDAPTSMRSVRPLRVSDRPGSRSARLRAAVLWAHVRRRRRPQRAGLRSQARSMTSLPRRWQNPRPVRKLRRVRRGRSRCARCAEPRRERLLLLAVAGRWSPPRSNRHPPQPGAVAGARLDADADAEGRLAAAGRPGRTSRGHVGAGAGADPGRRRRLRGNTAARTVSRIDPKSNAIVKRVAAPVHRRASRSDELPDGALGSTRDNRHACSLSQLDPETLVTNYTLNPTAKGQRVRAGGGWWVDRPGSGKRRVPTLVDPNTGGSDPDCAGTDQPVGAHGLALGGPCGLLPAYTEELYRFDRRQAGVEIGSGSSFGRCRRRGRCLY